jgi:hypothetical protein
MEKKPADLTSANALIFIFRVRKKFSDFLFFIPSHLDFICVSGQKKISTALGGILFYVLTHG